MQSICCILGAGYSHVAGAPLTRDLFAIRSVASPSVAAARRFETVWQDYHAWLSENPSRNSEEYLAELPKHRTIGSPVSRFSRPDALIPPFDWAVELLGSVLATPLPPDTMATNPRYGAGVIRWLHCDSHLAFWREVIAKAGRTAAITTNYDILIERGLRHRPMTRVFGPGCYYGGIPKPQLLWGTSVATGGNYIEMEGAVPVYKLHGSLNWSRTGELFQDLRPAFRGGGDAAIIPPVPEKEIPAWLQPVWSSAEEELARAPIWIVCGYSLPSYDVAITELLRRAAVAGDLKRILVLDPHASDICCRYSTIAQNVQVMPLEGLPEGINTLRKLL